MKAFAKVLTDQTEGLKKLLEEPVMRVYPFNQIVDEDEANIRNAEDDGSHYDVEAYKEEREIAEREAELYSSEPY